MSSRSSSARMLCPITLTRLASLTATRITSRRKCRGRCVAGWGRSLCRGARGAALPIRRCALYLSHLDLPVVEVDDFSEVEFADARFKVLVNDEEQYSPWPSDLPAPGGWSETGVCALK